MFTATQVVERARSQIGLKTIYEMSRGGFYPKAPTAADTMRRCDCSGFVAWCVGESRRVDLAPYADVLGHWVETTAMVRDARRHGVGMFDEAARDKAQPGMVIVYGDVPGHQGHTGIISAVDATGPIKVIHCSHGNYARTGDAVQETAADFFFARNALVAVCASVDYGMAT